MILAVPDPSSLVARCLAGDDAARAEFINTYDALLARAVARRLSRYQPRGAFASEADDIRHDIYLKLFANRCRVLESLRNARSLDAWLITVAHNQTVSYMRKRLVLEQAEDENVGEAQAVYGYTPEHSAGDRESSECVRAALEQLEAKDRLVLQLYYLYNQRYADIAETLGMNINTVASRLMRAKEKLREILTAGGA